MEVKQASYYSMVSGGGDPTIRRYLDTNDRLRELLVNEHSERFSRCRSKILFVFSDKKFDSDSEIGALWLFMTAITFVPEPNKQLALVEKESKIPN